MAYFDGWLIFAIRWFYLIFCFSPTITKNRCCSPVLDRKRDWIFYCYCCCFQLPFWSTGNLPSSPTRPLQPDHRLSSSVLPATLYPFGLESNADGGDRWTASSLSSSLSLHRIYVATQCRRCSCLLVVGDLFWLFFFAVLSTFFTMLAWYCSLFRRCCNCSPFVCCRLHLAPDRLGCGSTQVRTRL